MDLCLKKETVVLTAFLLLFSFAATPARGECEKIDSCTCRDSVTGKEVSLHPLANTEGKAAFTYKPSLFPDDRYIFFYNPCLNFTEEGTGNCQNVAMCQKDVNTSVNYVLGYQPSASFTGNSSSIALNYLGENTTTGMQRHTIVELVCDEEASPGTLEFELENPHGVYHFKLTSKCACPGACSGGPPQNPTCTPEGPKNCACRLSTDNELINLLSLDNPSAPLVVSTATSKIYLNLCSGMNLGGGCTDSVACVQQAGQYVEYGHPLTGNYSVDPTSDEVTLTYKSLDSSRETRVRLICDRAQRHYPRLVDVGEPTQSLLELELRSVCACPGECFSPVTTCTKVDDCTCSLNEGLGTISLHDLDNPFAPLRRFVENEQEPSTGVWYYYNPCTNFSVPGQQNLCHNVAACQVGSPTPIDFPLGLQNTVTYRTSSTDSDVVTLLYTEGYHDRQVAVTIHCNQSATVPSLTFDFEEPAKHYYLSLSSSVACPKQTDQEEGLEGKTGLRKVRPSRPEFRN